MTRSRVAQIVAYLVVVAVAGVGLLRVDGVARKHAAEAETTQVRECEQMNESRASTRTLVERANIESGEALIEVAGTDPEDSPLVEEYRRELARRMASLIAEHEQDDRDCAAEARERAERSE